ncbi:cytosol aminopeptidase-like isoform X2 [Clavelina lepadiformis]
MKQIPPLKTGQAKTFLGFPAEFSSVTVVGLGSENPTNPNPLECFDEEKEKARIAFSAGIKNLKDFGCDEVEVDVSCEAHAAAEGSFLSSWAYKDSDKKKFPSLIKPTDVGSDQAAKDEWAQGKINAECQNWARYLMDSPANLMTPRIFAENVSETILNSNTAGSVSVKVHDKDWIEKQKMGAFLSVAKGSDEPPKFVEIHYSSEQSSEEDRPLVLVGKGVTFDSGGISIKAHQGMDLMRADMGGAATMASALLGAARLNLPGRVTALIPLCENMPSGKANKPGDVVTARNGTTIQVDNTDFEGRLLLADALSYAQDQYKPSAILNTATLTGEMMVALGAAATGVFANSNSIWDQLHEASVYTGDRVWRMPLFDLYTNQMKPGLLADINNVATRAGQYGGACNGGACTAAAFLRHFVEKDTPWAHLDIASVMLTNEADLPYLGTGVSGRPTRTLIEFIRNFKGSV